MSYNLFLDDARFPKNVKDIMDSKPFHKTSSIKNYYDSQTNWVIVRDFNSFVKIINEKGLPELISFDHDLADEHYVPEYLWSDFKASKEYQEKQSKNYKEKTGFECAKYLVDFILKDITKSEFPVCFIHSKNPPGAYNIEFYIRNFMKIYPQFKSKVVNVVDHTY